jgi:hypothetical protein
VKSLAPYRDCLGSERAVNANCSGRGSFDRGDLKEVGGAAGRAMEPQAVFESFETSCSRAAAARNSGEIDFDVPEFGGSRVPGRSESCEEGASIAHEHTNTPARESTWFGPKMLSDLRAVEACAQGRQFPGGQIRADAHLTVT